MLGARHGLLQNREITDSRSLQDLELGSGRNRQIYDRLRAVVAPARKRDASLSAPGPKLGFSAGLPMWAAWVFEAV